MLDKKAAIDYLKVGKLNIKNKAGSKTALSIILTLGAVAAAGSLGFQNFVLLGVFAAVTAAAIAVIFTLYYVCKENPVKSQACFLIVFSLYLQIWILLFYVGFSIYKNNMNYWYLCIFLAMSAAVTLLTFFVEKRIIAKGNYSRKKFEPSRGYYWSVAFVTVVTSDIIFGIVGDNVMPFLTVFFSALYMYLSVYFGILAIPTFYLIFKFNINRSDIEQEL